jgi:hypothetical protein
VLGFLSSLSDLPLTRETDGNIAKLQFLNDSIYYLLFTVVQKKAIWQFGKIAGLVNFIVQNLQSCKINHLFLCQFLW